MPQSESESPGFLVRALPVVQKHLGKRFCSKVLYNYCSKKKWRVLGVCPIMPLSLFCPWLSLFCPWLSLFCPWLSLSCPWLSLFCPLLRLFCQSFFGQDDSVAAFCSLSLTMVEVGAKLQIPGIMVGLLLISNDLTKVTFILLVVLKIIIIINMKKNQ